MLVVILGVYVLRVSTGRSATSLHPAAGVPKEPNASTLLATGYQPHSDPADTIRLIKQSVVLIQVEGPDHVGGGTGFPVSEDRVATCAHVVAGATSITVVASDGAQIPATVVATDARDDLALLNCGPGLPPALKLGRSEDAREGDEIAVTGYPVVDKLLRLGFVPTPSTTRGTISAVRVQRSEAGESDQLQIDAAINPGNSGGPVYSVRSGEVLGLASARMVEETGIGFAAPVDALRRILGQSADAKPPRLPAGVPASAALFSVGQEGSLDTVLLLKRGKYLEPTHPSLEGATAASMTFDATYFRPGRVFKLIFGGGSAGTARVVTGGEQPAGVTLTARVQLQTTAPLHGRVRALATDAPELVPPISTRRSPTDAERQAALNMARMRFSREGIPRSALHGITIGNLTAGDLDGDGRAELIGSFQLTHHGCEQNLFLIIEPGRAGGFREALARYHPSKNTFGVDRQDQRLLDWVDLDGDGVAEVVTRSDFYEWWEYTAYSRHAGKWSQVYHGHGGGA